MNKSETIDTAQLGRLSALSNSPVGEQFWEGHFKYRDIDREEESRFFLCVTNGHEPTEAQIDFARQILANIDTHIDNARRLLKEALLTNAATFGISPDEAESYRFKPDELLPFATPEPTFYEPGEWQVRFAESPLPACDPYGVSVIFVGERPDRIEDLSDSEPIQ